MLDVFQGGSIDVERGPNCLFIRLRITEENSLDSSAFAETVWSVLDRHFTYRVVLDLDDVKVLRSHLLGQLVTLSKRIQDRNGLLRLSGGSPNHRDTLRLARLNNHLPLYSTREDALMPVGTAGQENGEAV